MRLDIDWRTTSMRLMDPEYGAMVPLVATGRYGVQVQDAERFLLKLIGTMHEFTSSNLTDQFMGPLSAKTNSAVVSYMSANRVGITRIAAHLEQLGNFIRQSMDSFWSGYGLKLVGFYVTSIDVDTTTPEGQKISEAISDRSAQNIAGYTWQQRQTFDVASEAMSGGSDMGILGMAMMTGMLTQGTNGLGQGILQQPDRSGFNTAPAPANNPEEQLTPGSAGGAQRANTKVFCANCGKPYASSCRFCPHCGHEYNPCPICGADNERETHRCATCGAELQNVAASIGADTTCQRCGTIVQPGTKFCPQCGTRIN